MLKILVFAFTLFALEAMADAMLAAAIDGQMHGPEATLTGTEPEARRLKTAAPGHGDATNTPHGHGLRDTATNTPHGHGLRDTAPALAMKKPRSLAPQPSIDENDNIRHINSVCQTVLKAAEVKDDALDRLAAEHLHNFRNALGSECARRLAPNRVVRIATGCTGSGAEVFCLLAIINAFRDICPKLRFKYVFHCERDPTKRKFVQTLHQQLADRRGASEEPCGPFVIVTYEDEEPYTPQLLFIKAGCVDGPPPGGAPATPAAPGPAPAPTAAPAPDAVAPAGSAEQVATTAAPAAAVPDVGDAL